MYSYIVIITVYDRELSVIVFRPSVYIRIVSHFLRTIRRSSLTAVIICNPAHTAIAATARLKSTATHTIGGASEGARVMVAFPPSAVTTAGLVIFAAVTAGAGRRALMAATIVVGRPATAVWIAAA